MGILRKASDEYVNLSLDETDFITVRADISKREFNALAANMPTTGEGGSLTPEQATGFGAYLFDTLVVGWSLFDGKPTVDDYLGLSAESGQAIDAALAGHFESLLPTSAEGK